MSIAQTLVFLTVVKSAQEEHYASILIDSIRDFSGQYRDCEIYVARSGQERLPCEHLKARGAKIVTLEMDDRLKGYPLADKVYACAQLERMIGNESRALVWMNPECLVLRPPVELTLKPHEAIAVRPVHIRNVGSPIVEPVNDYWLAVFKALGVDPARAFAVESFVDGQKIRAYFNCGTMSIRPERKLCQFWKESFEELALDKAFQQTLDKRHVLFLHQVVFSTLLVARLQPPEIKMLPPEYGYPLHLHGELPSERKSRSLNDLTTVIYEEYFQRPNWAEGIAIHEPLKSWLASRLPR